jgi:hypothetical protein
MTESECLKLWRKRLADTLRAFRKVKGRWPTNYAVEASKRGIAQAVELGQVPETRH